jgi:RNA polymerase sigma factor (sigma-70 family)
LSRTPRSGVLLFVRDVEEQPIVDGLRRGERAAFDAAYTRFRQRIFAFLLRLSGRRDVAEELSQETWLKLSRAASRLAEDTDLSAWLFTVARNAWVSHRRWTVLDLSRLVALDDEPASIDFEPEQQSGVEERLDARRSIARLERALGTLPASSREVLLLVGVEGFDHDRAAAILDCKPEALRQRLSRARERLSSALAALPPGVHTERPS